MTVQEAFSQWDKYRAEYGVADFLRCSAMSCIDASTLTRADYLAEAERRGYNKATAARCWTFVTNQGATK